MKCNSCSSENTVIKTIIKNMEKEFKKYGRKMTFDEISYCECQDCNSSEEINHWIKEYTIYNEPQKSTVIGDVEVLAELTSGNSIAGYSTIELISLEDSPYSKYKGEKIYLLCDRFSKGDYPIKITEEDVKYILNSLDELYNCNKNPKDHANIASIYINTTLSRTK